MPSEVEPPPAASKRQRRRDKDHRAAKRRKRRHNDDVRSDSSTSSSDNSLIDKANLSAKFPFTSGNSKPATALPPKAQEFMDAIKAYRKAGWLVTVKAFNRYPNRPVGFPFSLVQTLVRGYCVCAAKVLMPDDYDAKKVPKPTNSFVSIWHHFPTKRVWRKVITLIQRSTIFAFPCTEDNVNNYFKHMQEMADVFAARGDWSLVVDYDAKLRIEFATRPAFTFADFNHNALTSVRAMAQEPTALSSAQSSSRTRSSNPPSLIQGSANQAPTSPSKGSASASKRRFPPMSAPKAIWHGSIKNSECRVSTLLPSAFSACRPPKSF